MTQKKKYKKALKKIMKLAEMPKSETPQQRIKRLKGIAEKALFIPDVVVSEERTELPNDKWVTEYCHDHTPYWGACVTCGRY